MSAVFQAALKSTVEPLMLALTALDSIMLGIVVVQVIYYCRHAQTNKTHIVAMVSVAVGLTVIATIFLMHWSTHMFVWSFGNIVPFAGVSFIIRDLAIGQSSILLVQIFYVDRACRFYSHWWPGLLLMPFVLASFALCTATLRVTTVKYNALSPTLFQDPAISVLAYSWLGAVLATDLLITIIIATGLRRIKTGWSHTDSILRRLVIRCFETQTPALLSSIAMLIAWQSRYDLGVIFASIQSKFYTIGLLTSLNFRAGSPSNVTAQASKSKSQTSESSHPMHMLSRSHSHAHERHPTDKSAHDGASVDVHEDEYASTTGLRRM
ncbi:uncharacterized protein MKK02DRAFT_39313 [Dioszegia hungarica]|uniref:DUF6534 domain-containing protein n=1 Tax=Dioszegia hungarica TaxID=4972 RepID=A0AA38H350_9TREE|nr:uncharacterized protein MKK02DRAFT_39313 [Dioszegia hungarica]KAI9633333.1 hypothetical protein MKK02DRAFT_39313 [Dioszegia hungarica]